MSEQWLDDLAALIDKARREGMWLFINSIATGPMWFSPDQLAAENAAGRFRWGVVNWHLRDPKEMLAAAERKVAEAEAERKRIAAMVG